MTIKSYPDLPDWTFQIAEVSAGVYEVIATGRAGHRVSDKGIDVEDLTNACRERASEIGSLR
ncbi:MAG: hypothetical protein PW790_12640 [Parvibaculaceae bacterium]|nr:hypothetical protein [Parvibaculaceae bacterium]